MWNLLPEAQLNWSGCMDVLYFKQNIQIEFTGFFSVDDFIKYALCFLLTTMFNVYNIAIHLHTMPIT